MQPISANEETKISEAVITSEKRNERREVGSNQLQLATTSRLCEHFIIVMRKFVQTLNPHS